MKVAYPLTPPHFCEKIMVQEVILNQLKKRERCIFRQCPKEPLFFIRRTSLTLPYLRARSNPLYACSVHRPLPLQWGLKSQKFQMQLVHKHGRVLRSIFWDPDQFHNVRGTPVETVAIGALVEQLEGGVPIVCLRACKHGTPPPTGINSISPGQGGHICPIVLNQGKNTFFQTAISRELSY